MFSVIVTVGPGVLEDHKIRQINALGDCIFRINGAHANGQQTKDISNEIRRYVSEAKIMIDLPGNKIRTKNLIEPLRLVKGEKSTLKNYEVNYPYFFKHLKPGDIIYANDSIFTLELIDVSETIITFLSHSDGKLLTNKGLHVQGIHDEIPFLFDQDKELIKVAGELNLDIVSLSFVRTVEDVILAKDLLGKQNSQEISIFAKIETEAAIKNLGAIFNEVDTVNVDRGDLSTDIGILNLPSAQERIIESALRAKKNIFLATQFLKNMENSPVPLIAELIGIHDAIKSGITGIQLSEETAVGKYPVECVKLIFDLYHSSFSA
jgi:pyruvate kinase